MLSADAFTLIRQLSERMRVLYRRPVFDEWAVITLSSSGAKLSFYEGPRIETFRQRFLVDAAPLAAELSGRELPVGAFAFAPEARGTHFDACVRLGLQAYLLCNHTSRTMEEIRADPFWLHAQKPFVDFTERIRADPVE